MIPDDSFSSMVATVIIIVSVLITGFVFGLGFLVGRSGF
jgi:hypothetical protein